MAVWTAADDERTVAQLFCDQLEFANVIIMNKMDLMDDAGRARLRAILRRFNPTAQLIGERFTPPCLRQLTEIYLRLSSQLTQSDALPDADQRRREG